MNLAEFVASREGFSAKAYDLEGDIAGVDTIGYGHLLTENERQTGMLVEVPWANGITKAHALKVLAQDLRISQMCVDRNVKVPLTENQRIALVSFVFNLGCGAFCRSTLLKRLNAGEYEAVPAELGRWIKNNGRVIKGLINRRNKEAEMWSGQA
jgi:lysozyme